MRNLSIESRNIFSFWIFFNKHSRITGEQAKWKAISLTCFYLFHSLHGHLDLSPAITTEN